MKIQHPLFWLLELSALLIHKGFCMEGGSTPPHYPGPRGYPHQRFAVEPSSEWQAGPSQPPRRSGARQPALSASAAAMRETQRLMIAGRALKGAEPWYAYPPVWDSRYDPYVTGEDGEKLRIIKPIKLEDGREYGPYHIGKAKIDPKAIPLDLPWFRPLYLAEPLAPVDFEDDASKYMMHPKSYIYRPEPHILEGIRRKIAYELDQQGTTLTPVREGSDLLQGQYLWPPVVLRKGDYRHLNMRWSFLEHVLYGHVLEQFNKHEVTRPTMYRLTIPVDGGLSRPVLMVQGTWLEHTEINPIPPRSNLWYFFEGMEHHSKGPQLALLGAMALPQRAAHDLFERGAITSAFKKLPPP